MRVVDPLTLFGIRLKVEILSIWPKWEDQTSTAALITDPEIRLCVFTTMMDIEPFYIHLAQVEMLQLIFVALQDEEYSIRQAVICLLGKLSDINPAHVMPSLRIVLIQVNHLITSTVTWLNCFFHFRFLVSWVTVGSVEMKNKAHVFWRS